MLTAEYLQGGSQLGGEAQGEPEEGWSEKRHVEGTAKPTKELSEGLGRWLYRQYFGLQLIKRLFDRGVTKGLEGIKVEISSLKRRRWL